MPGKDSSVQISQKDKDNWSSGLATFIYPLEGFSVQCLGSSEYYRSKVVLMSLSISVFFISYSCFSWLLKV